MTVVDIMDSLKEMGSPNIKQILLKHGVKEPLFGVKVGQLKVIQKQIKRDYQLAKDLYDTGNADAMYLAGLIADDQQMTRTDLEHWVKKALSNNISEYSVPWVAAQGKFGYELGLKWIENKEEHIAAAGWATLSNVVALKADNELDTNQIKSLLNNIISIIHNAPNRVRYTMNGFIIAVGSYVKPLYNDAIKAANQIGAISVNMNGTSCAVPDALDYIEKMNSKGLIGKKKKTVKC